MNKLKGFTGIELAVVLALVTVVTVYIVNPKFIHGESRRADQSQQATQQVVQTQHTVDQAQQQVDVIQKEKSAKAAASVTTMVTAAEEAPKSPHTAFIAKEGRLALTYLEKPDQTALLASEQRYSAFLEGKVELIQNLYQDAYLESRDMAIKLDKAESAKAKAEKDRDDAIAKREAVDQKLIVAAAEHRATERQRNIAILACVVAFGLWVWAKSTHFSPFQIMNAVHDIKNGAEPIVALDTSASPLQQRIVNLLTRLLK